MHLLSTIPAALMLASALAKPVQPEKRQVGGLGGGLSPVLGIISQILPQSGGGLPGLPTGTGSAVPSSVASILPATPSLPAGVSANGSCTEAIDKINDAIAISSALANNAGGKTTTQDILIVLALLQNSLGKDCNVAGLPNIGGATGFGGSSGLGSIGPRDMASQHEAADDPLSGIVGDGDSPNGLLGDLLGGGDDDEDWNDNRGCAEYDDPECADIYTGIGYGDKNGSRMELDTDKLKVRDVTDITKCTACEAALYSVVQTLQKVFTSTGGVSIPGQPKLTAAVQRVKMEANENMMRKRCNGGKC